MKTVLTFLLISVLSFQAFSQTPAWTWAVAGIPSTLREQVATDTSGNVYRAGYNLSKYGPTGSLLWSHNLVSAAGSAYVTGLAADMNGNTIISGYIVGTIQLDSITIKSFNRQDIFIARFNANGSILWAKLAGGTRKTPPPGICCYIEDAAYSLALDQSGNSYLFCTSENDTVQFEGLTFIADSAILPSFVAKYDAFGVIQWVQEVENFRSPVHIAIGLNGSFYLAGIRNLPGPTGQGKVFTEKYSAVGGLEWRQWSAGQGFETIYNVASDVQGNCYITGNNEATTAFGTYTLPVTSAQSKNMFAVKYSKSGQVRWAKQATSAKVSGLSAGTTGEAVVVDNHLNVYVAGSFTNNVTFSGQTPVSSVSPAFGDVYVAKLDSAGNFLWMQKAGGSGSDWVESITVFRNNDCFVAGVYNNSCTFGQFTLSASSGGAFTARLSGNPTGISENNFSAAFSIYPNPATESISFKATDFKEGQIVVYNATGQTVYAAEVIPEMQIPVANWPAGIYAIKLTFNGKTQTQKLVVSR